MKTINVKPLKSKVKILSVSINGVENTNVGESCNLDSDEAKALIKKLNREVAWAQDKLVQLLVIFRGKLEIGEYSQDDYKILCVAAKRVGITRLDYIKYMFNILREEGVNRALKGLEWLLYDLLVLGNHLENSSFWENGFMATFDTKKEAEDVIKKLLGKYPCFIAVNSVKRYSIFIRGKDNIFD